MNFPFKSFLSLKTKLPLYHFLSFLHFHDFLKAFLFIFKNYYREHAQHTQLSPALNQSIAQEFYHHEILLNYLHCQSYKNLITEFQISLIYSTFENNGWEKMLMKARNEAKAKTKVIAYQHVPIADSALNYDITTEDKNYLPDAIFTLGKATFERLKKSGYPSDILKLGCSIRTNLKVPTTAIPYQKIKRILIALDGMHQAAILPNYFAAYLLDLKKLGYETTFRFHPAFNLNQMKKFFTFPDQLVEAIKVSTQSLDQDLGDADLIVYYGSTVAFEGLARGKRVVHLYSPQEMLLNDPIEVHGGLHFRLSDQEPFLSYLEKLNSMSEAEFMQKQETSRAYVANYFIPYSTDKIQSILPQQILGK